MFRAPSNIDNGIIFSKSFITDVELGPKNASEIKLFWIALTLTYQKIVVDLGKSFLNTEETEYIVQSEILNCGLCVNGY